MYRFCMPADGREASSNPICQNRVVGATVQRAGATIDTPAPHGAQNQAAVSSFTSEYTTASCGAPWKYTRFRAWHSRVAPSAVATRWLARLWGRVMISRRVRPSVSKPSRTACCAAWRATPRPVWGVLTQYPMLPMRYALVMWWMPAPPRTSTVRQMVRSGE